MRKIQGYGWQPDLPDHRDHLYRVAHLDELKTAPLLSSTMTPHPVPHKDQGNLGSCTANAAAAMFEQVFRTPPRSRLEIYYQTRVIESTVKFDTGASLRDTLKVLNQLGAGLERLWPYHIQYFAEPPPAREMTDASAHKVMSYSSLTTREDFQACLSAGFPFVIGFSVYEAFEGDDVSKYGIVNLPDAAEHQVGGHAVLVIGHDTKFSSSTWAKHALASGYSGHIPEDVYIVQNSWGAHWGHGGNFAIDARYFEDTNLADDAWTIRP
jgi:C1A family cysteine protease